MFDKYLSYHYANESEAAKNRQISHWNGTVDFIDGVGNAVITINGEEFKGRLIDFKSSDMAMGSFGSITKLIDKEVYEDSRVIDEGGAGEHIDYKVMEEYILLEYFHLVTGDTLLFKRL